MKINQILMIIKKKKKNKKKIKKKKKKKKKIMTFIVHVKCLIVLIQFKRIKLN
jgi:hypothetical protein